jgi:polysaccharide export outer membrane protein
VAQEGNLFDNRHLKLALCHAAKLRKILIFRKNGGRLPSFSSWLKSCYDVSINYQVSPPRNLQFSMHHLKSSLAGLAWLSLAIWASSVVPLSAQTETASEKKASVSTPLSAEDIIQITVFQEPDLETKTRISQAGTITFPLIGEVKVGGLTPEAAAQSIRTQLAKDYIVNPQVMVSVTEYSKRRFTVLGQVQKPGAYEMPDRSEVSLLQALGTAGGYTRFADPSDIKVKRTVDGKETLYKLNAKNMASGNDPTAFVVQSGDIITVGESVF